MNWHYADNGQQVGPVSDEQLLQLFQSGKINADTLVWHEGLADWTPYHQATAHLNLGPQPPSQQPLAAAAGAPGEDEVVCAECGKFFPVHETMRFGKVSVCAACKPVFLQKLSEGARINSGELNYARILTRFAAVLVDGLLLAGVNVGINTIVQLIFIAPVARNVTATGAMPTTFLALQFVLLAVNLAIGLTYEVVMIGKYGATLGKMACKIKVVTADGGQVSYARALGRYFAKMLSGMVCAIGYIIACFDDERRALHDHLCNTRVVIRET